MKNLKCDNFICPSEEICYLLQSNKHQLVEYEHCGHLTAGIFRAINECTKLHSLTFADIYIDGPFDKIPSITDMKYLAKLVFVGCESAVVRVIHRSLLHAQFSNLFYIDISLTEGNIHSLSNLILMKCPLLKHLDLQENDGLHDKGLRNIRNCKT